MGQNASVPDCKPCSIKADPVSDTVKVDGTLLAQANLPESPKPQDRAFDIDEAQLSAQKEEEDRQREAEEEELRKLKEERAAEEARQRREMEEKAEAEARAAEQQRQQEEARLEAEENERREAAEAAHQEEGKRKLAEEAAAAAAKEQAAKAEAHEAVDAYLQKGNFKNLSAPRKAFCGAAVFPFFLAVEDGDAEMVKAMLLCDPKVSQQKNAAGKTAREVAEKLNKNGSHTAVLAALP